MLNKILSIFPFLEVIIRILYWKSEIVHKAIGRITSRKNKKNSNIDNDFDYNISKLLDSLNEMGIERGDTLIVHSAFAELKCFGLSAEQILNELFGLIGEEGNLIMPGIPILRNQPKPFDRFKLKNYSKIPFYDVQNSKCWTGLLPQTLLKKAGALRSRSPLNSMVVHGPDAKALVRNDLFSKASLPCGENSVLALALEYNAKIVFLGVDEVHNMTMIHVAEDLYIDEWPIMKWFWKRPFEIVDGDYHEIVMLSERNPFWALFYAERRFSRDLLKNRIIERTHVGKVSVSVCDGNKLIDFLRSNGAKEYPYFIPFWRFWSKNNA